MQARVPANLIEGGYEIFPVGAYNGEIASAAIRDPNGDGSWLTLKVGISNVTPKDGTADPGRNRFQGDLTIETDGVNLLEVEDFGDDSIPFVIRKSAGLLAGLAQGLGVLERADGAEGTVDLREVVEALIDGQFEGENVGFEVAHWASKDKPKDFRDQYGQFGHAG